MKYFFLFSIFLFCITCNAQETIVEKTEVEGLYKLSDVVVSATKTQTSTLELANSITVIDSTEIVNRNASNVFDLLKTEYGITFTNQGGKGSLSNISIRGGNSDYTLVLVDGIEVNLNSDPSNVYDFAFLGTDNIHSIEILRGPQSTLYGSNSLAGVINIITKRGNSKPSFSLLAEAGSYKTYKTSLGMNGLIGDFTYSASFGRSESEGFSSASEKYGNFEKDGYRKDNISARFGYDFGSSVDLNLFMKYNKSKSEYDQFGGEFGDDPTYLFNQEEFSFHGESKINLLDGNWNQKIGGSIIKNVRNYFYDTSSASIYYSKSLYDGRKYKVDWQNDIRIGSVNLVTTGLEYEIEQASSDFFQKTFLSPPDYISIFPKQESKTFGVYLQNQFNFTKRFFGSIGIRIDNHNKFGSVTTYRLAPAYLIWETGTKIKGTIGTGFKAPSLFYLFDPLFGNQNLKPEKSLGFDVGFEQFLMNDKFSVGVTYFQNNYKDLFGFDSNFKTINVKKAKTNGVESYFIYKLQNLFEIKMNYTFTRAIDESGKVAEKDKKLLRRPEHKASLFASYSFDRRANVNTELIYVSTREDMNFSKFERVKLNNYLLLNLSASYQPLEFLRLNLRFENILDSDYEEVYGYATPCFSIYGGVKLSLNDL